MQAFIQQVKSSLEQNSNLNEKAKENIFLIVQKIDSEMQTVYASQFSQKDSMPTNLLIERLKTLSLKMGSEFLNQEAYEYNIGDNTIYFRSKEIEERSQCNILCQALLELIYIKDPRKVERGIDGRKFVAIKKGTLEILANFIVQNDGEKGIAEDEQIIVNMMNIITDGKILECFLQADSKRLEEIIMNQEYRLMSINSYANYNAIYKNGSQLGNIQQMLIDAFFSLPKEEIKSEKIADLELYISPKTMCFSSHYNEPVKQYFQNMKNQFYTGKPYQNEIDDGLSDTMISQVAGYEAFITPEDIQRKIS